MKDIFKRTYRSVILLGVFGFFILSMFLPIFKVNAYDNKYGTGDNCITTDVTVDAGQEELFDIKSVSIDGNAKTDGYQYCVSGDTHRFVITVTKKGESIPDIGWGGNWNNNASIENVSNVGNDYTFIVNVVTPDDSNSYFVSLWAKEKPMQQNHHEQNNDPQQNQNGDDNRVGFSGNAWFLWNCDGNVCAYLAHDIENQPLGTHSASEDNPYIIHYIKESEVIDAESGKKLEIDNLKAGDYFWTWEDQDFRDRLEYERIDESKIEEIFEKRKDIKNWKDLQNYVDWLDSIAYEAKKAFAIDPCGSRDSENSLSTNGDRNFRATIYDDKQYMGIVFGVSRSDYEYFLPEWDPVFFNSEMDISETTIDDPAIYNVYLLENNLKFNLSSRINSDISSIKPININKNAVSISESNGTYTVNFKSNFYNEVEFEVTDKNGKKYYFQLNRMVLNAYDRITDDGPVLNIEFLYPDVNGLDDIKNYELICNIVYKDGSTKIVTLENNGVYRDANMDGIPVLQKTWKSDKGLNGAGYTFEITKDMKDLYVNVIHKGAFDKESFGGAFAGSGLGLKYDSTRLSQVINDYYNRGGNR